MKNELNTAPTHVYYGSPEVNELVASAMRARSEYLAKIFGSAWSGVKSFFKVNVIKPLAQAIDSAQAYDQLSRLSDRDLKDLGIDRSQIAHYAFRAGEADLTISSPANVNTALVDKARTAA
ncbi:MAG: DUF1127 domain-containing protein [Rhodospirillaceae bacterium]|jgi:uncharacterized protein YjiS (DUF1127 family)